MTEDAPTLEGESAMVLDGLAVGVDHLEAIVVFFLSVAQPYASWVRPGADVRPGRLGEAMREAYIACETALRTVENEPQIRSEAPGVTIESQERLVFVHRVRTFGVAVCFERDAPLGFARLAVRQIVRTLDHELPYPPAEVPVVVLPHNKPTVPGSSIPAPAQLEFDGADQGVPSDTSPPPRSGTTAVGDRVRGILRYLEENAPDPHLVRLRVALRSGLGLEAIDHPDHLASESLLLVETAAEDILGLDHGKLGDASRAAEAEAP